MTVALLGGSVLLAQAPRPGAPRFADGRSVEPGDDVITIQVLPLPGQSALPAPVSPAIRNARFATGDEASPVVRPISMFAVDREGIAVLRPEMIPPSQPVPTEIPRTVVDPGVVVPSPTVQLYPRYLPPATPPVQRNIDAAPDILQRRIDGPGERPVFQGPAAFLETEDEPPLGFTGPSGVVPRSGRNKDFVTVEDRWRMGSPEWNRYGHDNPRHEDEPYELGHWWDPYNQNVLKGDFPIAGQHTFLTVTGTSLSLYEYRGLPVATTPFESTARPNSNEFFGRNGQRVYSQFLFLSLDLFSGDAAFKPMDWRVKVTPTFNYNSVYLNELALVSPDVRKGRARDRTWLSLQEYFGELKLADLSPEYDFVSIRAGSQPFTSDFRGLIFSDVNRGVRLFGTLNGNRDQFNLAYFKMTEKDTNSGLNMFQDRGQDVIIANYFRQDFVFPGYTSELSFHFNNDAPSTKYDKNGFLVRPDPAGVFQEHRVQAAYLGWAGDGHIDRYNISHSFYWVLGRDSFNPIANQEQEISAQLATVELSYDRDWARFRFSGLWASGDGKVNNKHATGFDSILDNQNFGGEFGYFGRQAIGLFGVNLTQRNSLLPDLRSSKTQGQSNFVNPGLWLINGGFDLDITPKFRVINNASFLMFDKTNVLETFAYQTKIDRKIGLDLSTGFEYRPLLSNNIIIIGGFGTLLPSAGFADLYTKFRGDPSSMFQAFMEVTLTY